MKQFNDLFKILLDVPQEYNTLLGDYERCKMMMWTLKEQVCSFKRKVHCWPREAAQRAKSSKCLSRSSWSISDKGSMNSKRSKDTHESKSSRESKDKRSSKPSKDREIKVAELIAKPELLQQKRVIQNEAEKLKRKDILPKVKAIIQAYSNIELEGSKGKQQLQPKLLENNWMRSLRTDDVSKVVKIEIEQEELPLLERNKMLTTEIPETFRMKQIEKAYLIKQ